MPDLILRTGNPETVPYTPGAGDVAEGQVVLLGNLAGIGLGVAQVPIVNNVLGALAVVAGDWEAINLNNAANYAKVFWDNATKKATTVSTNNALLGFVASGGGGGANSLCRVRLFTFV